MSQGGNSVKRCIESVGKCMFNKKYEVIKDAPKEIEWKEYERASLEEYQRLLKNSSDDEKIFQKFFERNPAFIPDFTVQFG